jgi:EmrB/QacA subfamily drug resistance transporter
VTTLPLPSTATTPTLDSRRWWLLAVTALAQLVILLDITIVTVALPSAQASLDISDANRHWIVTAYAITFGGFLLLGGRLGDTFGRRRVFVGSLVGFGVASGLGGLATSSELLFAARALQGLFGAALAPVILSLITVTFTDRAERGRAFGIWGSVSGLGAALGMILGGVLTEYASWRWTLLVNVPIALILAVAASRVVTESRSERRGGFDVPGVLTSTVGVALVVFGSTQAEGHGWASASTLVPLVGGGALVASFIALEARSKDPLLPLSIFADRVRAGSFLVSALLGAAIASSNVFIIFYLQRARDMSILTSGLAFVPQAVAVVVFATIGARLMPRLGARPLVVTGALLGVAGFLLLSTVETDTTFVAVVGPGILLLGISSGLVWPVASSTSLAGVAPSDAGAAGGMVNVCQQVAGAVAIGVLNTVAATAADGSAGSLIDGLTTTFLVCAVIMLLAAIAAVVTLSPRQATTAPTVGVPPVQQ